MTIEFDKIRRDYPLPGIVTASGERLEKNGDEYKCPCPFHNEKTASFTIYNKAGTGWRFHCFGCGIHGDNIDYVKERYGVDTGEACRIITGDEKRAPRSTVEYREATNPYDGYDIGRPPADAPPILAGKRTPPILNPKRVDPKSGNPKTVTYTPSMVFPYVNKDGDLIGYVLRVEFDGKKITPGVWWTKNPAAKFTGWAHGSFPSPRPLYGLDQLYANPDHQVLLVEGEKCKDAAARLMEGKRVVPVTWMGGGKSISKTYWKSLKGRSVIVWPDADENREGDKTTFGYPMPDMSWRKGLLDYLFEVGASTVKVIHITPGSRKDGWDIADAEEEGLGQRGVELIMRDRIQTWTKQRHNQWKEQAKAKAGPQGVEDHDERQERVERETPPDDAANESDDGDRRQAGEVGSADARGDGQGSRNEPAGEINQKSVKSEEQQSVGRGFGIDEETWRQHLIMKADGDGLKSNSLQNFALLLQYERRFAGIFAWNDFAKEVYLQRRPPWDIGGNPGHWTVRKLTDPDVTSAACWLEYCGMSPKTNDIGKVIYRVAQANIYNPVIDRFESLEWDGVPRLSGNKHTHAPQKPWLSEYMGAADTTENAAFGRKWMVGAVARAYQPGCKLDTMLVIEGPQGLKKSTALKIISDAVTPGVFTDEISDPNSKDAGLQMQGMLVIELAELDAFRRAEISQIKSWLTRAKDRFRRPYGKIVEEFPRTCIFAGTVNPIGIGYLKDASGGRRFWPFEATAIDLDRITKDAPQLWAEAVAAYKDGETWWLNKDEEVYASIVQEARYEEDPYAEMIDAYLIAHTAVTTLAIMDEALGIPKERRNAVAQKRVVSHLHARKWERLDDNGRIVYRRPGATV